MDYSSRETIVQFRSCGSTPIPAEQQVPAAESAQLM
jgi:hypothetical protein